MNHEVWLWVALAAHGLHMLEEYMFDWKHWANRVLHLPVVTPGQAPRVSQQTILPTAHQQTDRIVVAALCSQDEQFRQYLMCAVGHGFLRLEW